MISTAKLPRRPSSQYLYLCTSKSSKLSTTRGVSQPSFCDSICTFCASKASKVSTCQESHSPRRHSRALRAHPGSHQAPDTAQGYAAARSPACQYLYACTSKASNMSTRLMARMRRSAHSPLACQYLYFCTSKASAARAPLGAADLLTLLASSTHFTGFTGTKEPGTLQGYGGGHSPASCRPRHSPRTAAPCTCRSFLCFEQRVSICTL